MSFPKDFTIETLHLILRCPSLDEIIAIFKASQVPGFTDGMHWSPPQHEDELIKPYENNIRAWEDGSAYCFSITEKESEEFLGRIAIRKDEDARTGIWNLGFYILPQYQGKGYMTESVRAILAFGFNKLPAHKIEASYAVWNIASERVLQKNGFTQDSHSTNNSNPSEQNGFFKDGKWVEQHTLAITLLDWSQLNATNLE